MVGYADNEEATSQAIDAEGWLHTGDLGMLDKRGQLVIVGRQKDVIVTSNGENVYPDDVETMLGKLDGVKELAIVGIAALRIPISAAFGNFPAANAVRMKPMSTTSSTTRS